MPHLEQIQKLESRIAELNNQIAANRANLVRIQSSSANSAQKASASQGTNKTITRINGEINVLINQIKELENQQDIIEPISITPEPIEITSPIQVTQEQQNGINLKNIAIIGAVLLLLG